MIVAHHVKLVKYYDEILLDDKTLSKKQREIYILERLEYAYLAKSPDAIKYFAREFDLALDEDRDDFARSLLREVTPYEHNYSKEEQEAIKYRKDLLKDRDKVKEYQISTNFQ